MNKFIKTIVKKIERYKDFTVFDTPRPFDEMYKDRDIPYVQVHSVEIVKSKDIVGFCGCFEWKNNEIKSLDGDSYNKRMLVLGESWFTNSVGEKSLDILVGNDW